VTLSRSLVSKRHPQRGKANKRGGDIVRSRNKGREFSLSGLIIPKQREKGETYPYGNYARGKTKRSKSKRFPREKMLL